MGTTLMVTQLCGASLPFLLLPRVRETASLSTALWVGVFAQSVSLAFLMFYCWLERFYASYLTLVDAADTPNDDVDCRVVHGRCLIGFQERVMIIPINTWLQVFAVCLIPVTQYVSLGLLPVYLTKTHGFNEVEAGNATSLVWWFCVTAPVWGLLADSPSVGRLHLQLAGSVTASLCFLLLSMNVNGWPVLASLGVSFAMLDQNSYVCVEALVPNPALIDFTYGIMGAFFNVSMGVIAFVAGHVPVPYMPFVFSASLGAGISMTLILLLRLDPETAVQKGLLPQFPAPIPSQERVDGMGRVIGRADEIEMSSLLKD